MAKATSSTESTNYVVRGASVSRAALIAARLTARQLRLRQQRRHVARQTGNHPAPFKGRGLSFQQLRAYQGGDEIRHIDWRVTARTTKPHTRVFEEERERPIVICLDQRRPMAFGSRHCFKSVMACHAAALLAWNGLDSNDRVGGLIFSDDRHNEFRPKRSSRAVLHLLNSACEYSERLLQAPAEDKQQALSSALEELRRITRPGSSVFILSDFHDYDDEAHKQLLLLSRHNDIVALGINDPLELRLPLQGTLPLSDGRQRSVINIDQQLQQHYRDHIAQAQQTLQQQLRQLGIVLLPLSTDDDLLEILSREIRLT